MAEANANITFIFLLTSELCPSGPSNHKTGVLEVGVAVLGFLQSPIPTLGRTEKESASYKGSSEVNERWRGV